MHKELYNYSHNNIHIINYDLYNKKIRLDRLIDLVYNTLGIKRYGPVVQLVRTLACHARGRRFEPVPGRHSFLCDKAFLCGCSSSGRAPPCQGGGSEFEPRHPLHLFSVIIAAFMAYNIIRRHSQVVRHGSAKP